MSTTVNDRILAELDDTTAKSARELLRKLREHDISKRDINSTLYKLLKSGDVKRIEGVPPTWLRVTELPEVEVTSDLDEDRNLVHVFIDADNSHCLTEAEAYGDKVVIWCAVSPQYAGAEASHPDTTFRRMESVSKSAADVQLGVWMTQQCEQHRLHGVDELFFILVSKDNLVATFGEVLKEHYPFLTIQIIRNSWEGLREWLE
jgi:hypothetical protein